MKHRYCLMTISLLAALSFSISSFSQTKVFGFGYDGSGNRIDRHLITLKSASLASALGESQEQEVFEETLDNREIKIYPNPTKGLLRVEIPLQGNEKRVVLQVYNMQGALISDQVVSDEITQVDLYNHPPGMYLLRIASGEEVSQWKIVKE
ncbi:T9SS type A sorting domain-containing protein [Mangrovibacterium sp.]|uniref:T9SS type A sorting domain-containing protein n=1 Tax=Mangrovibacterium sp. TaxID=1961364 RepID=UPI0035635D22